MLASPVRNRRRFTIGARIRSIRFAVHGIYELLRSEHNARLHAAATVFVICIGLWAGVTRDDWCWLITAAVAVWTAEAFNTALEFLCDIVSPEVQPLVEKAKDVAAGAVLFSACGAACIGLLVLGPRVLQRLQS